MTRTHLYAGLSAGLMTLAMAFPASAQSGKSPAVPQAPQARPAAGMLTDGEFVARAAMGDMFEIETSKLALTRSQDPDVKAFAQKMIRDHQTSSDRLQGILGQSGAPAQMPSSLDAMHRQKIARLETAQGKAFDAAYRDVQMEAHAEAVQLYTAYSKSGSNPALKAFATEVLPTIEMHHKQVGQLD